ncbi:MAG: hypothetical protein IKG21_11725 [Atopobiaceae bacterium]|nr:hypothetical protein [Atopobiaceae bacterium]
MPKHAKPEPDHRPKELLAPNEVAAVHHDQPVYVNDVPSPYLTQRQAAESVDKTRRRHRVITSVLVMLLLSSMAAGIAWFAWDTLKPAPKADVPHFNTAPIERKEFINSVDVTTIVHPIDERAVSSEITGTIAEMMVEEGMFVDIGTELYRLDNPTITETFDNAQKALDAAVQDVEKKTQALEAAKKALEDLQNRNTGNTSNTSTNRTRTGTNSDGRTTNDNGSSSSTTDATTNIARGTKPHFVQAGLTLYANELDDDSAYGNDGYGATSSNSNSYSNNSNSSTTSSTSSSSATSPTITSTAAAEARIQAAQKDLDAANERLGPIQETFDRAQAQLDHLIVRAPIAGTLHDINGRIGIDSAVSGAERLCTVTDYSAYILREQVPPERTEQVHEGLEARLTFPGIPDLFIASSVTSVEDAENGMRIASIVLEHPDERVAADMTCNASIIVQCIPDALVIPIEALRTNEDGSSHVTVLLDPTRGICADVNVNVIATSAFEAVIEADSIQVGTSVVV